MELVVERILAGGIAGIPTDTVYGLAALATGRGQSRPTGSGSASRARSARC